MILRDLLPIALSVSLLSVREENQLLSIDGLLEALGATRRLDGPWLFVAYATNMIQPRRDLGLEREPVTLSLRIIGQKPLYRRRIEGAREKMLSSFEIRELLQVVVFYSIPLPVVA